MPKYYLLEGNDEYHKISAESVSDGYHTFEELYEHRNLLFINSVLDWPEHAYISKYHSDGSSYDGWFVAGIHTHLAGQISYHLPDKYWNLLAGRVKIVDMAPFDGHTSNDVIERLKQIAEA